MLLADAARYVAEQSERRYRALVEAGTALMWTADANGLVVDMPHWHELTGLPARDALGDEWISAVHHDDQERIRDAFAAARVLGRPVDCELRLRSADGSYRWLEVRAAPVRGDEREIVEWVGTWTDVHERKRAEEALSFLSDASRVLLATSDLQTTLERLTHLIVPRVADLCHIDLLDEATGELRRATEQHADPEKLAIMRELVRRYPPATNPLYASATAVRTGQTRLLNDLDDLYYLSLAVDDDHLSYIRAVAPRSYIAAPLVVRGRTLGALVVFQAESKRRYTEADANVIEELARRTALTVDHAHQLAAERRAHAVAESTSHAKSDFLAAMSHEIRIPLNSIVGYADLLTEEIAGPITSAQRDHLNRMSASARHLIDVTDHVSMLARIESGREKAILSQVDVAAVCREAASVLEPDAMAKGIRLDVAIAGDVGKRRTDLLRLRQILIHLLSNAVKFTATGTVSLVVRADRDWVRFIVRDSGAGIPASEIEHVFDGFSQPDASTVRREATGLGLVLARDLARLLGGDITVASVEGQGSTFTVRLPA